MCLRFNYLIGKQVKRQIVWHTNQDELRQLFLFSTGEFITSQHNCLLSRSSYCILRPDLSSKITKLITFDPFIFSGNFNFGNLEHLEISSGDSLQVPSDVSKTIFLNLDCLKVLKIDLSYEEEEYDEFGDVVEKHPKLTIYVNCPMLKSLCLTNRLEEIRILHPETIVHLVKIFDEFDYSDESLADFVNLEKLAFEVFDYDEYPCKLFDKLKSLKELSIHELAPSETLDQLIEEKEEYGLNRLKLYYKNVDVEDAHFDYGRLENVRLYNLKGEDIDMYGDFIHCLNFNLCAFSHQVEIIAINSSPFNLQFLSNFSRIVHLVVSVPIVDQYSWQMILKSMKLIVLDLTVPMNQSLLDEIPVLKSTLKTLDVNQSDTNLNFVLDLINLKSFTIYDRIIDLDLLIGLMNKLKHLETIQFSNDFKISIANCVNFIYNGNTVLREPKNVLLFYLSINKFKTISQLFNPSILYV